MVKPNTFYNESQSNLPPTPPDGLIESGETLSLNEIWFRIYVFLAKVSVIALHLEA